MRPWGWGEHRSTQADVKPTSPLKKGLHNILPDKTVFASGIKIKSSPKVDVL